MTDAAAGHAITVSRSAGVTVDILDVGHGNCIIVSNSSATVLVDAGPGTAVLEYLLDENITNIQSVVLSHADADHIRGLIALLGTGEFHVGTIVLNSDSAKGSQSWQALAYEIDQLKRSGRIVVIPAIREGDVIPCDIDGVKICALAPRQRLAQLGPGARDGDSRAITTNTISAVLKVIVDEEPTLLIPGDIDSVGFAHLMDTIPDLEARYLVLPHHGGLSGTTPETEEMTYQLCQAVKPIEVFVTNARGRFGNPRPEVVRSVRNAIPACHIACTQLSKNCSADLPSKPSLHVGTRYADGKRHGHCCAGTIRLERGNGIGAHRDTSLHDDFIDSFAATALCRSNSNGAVQRNKRAGSAQALEEW